jgi:hypothetical protein
VRTILKKNPDDRSEEEVKIVSNFISKNELFQSFRKNRISPVNILNTIHNTSKEMEYLNLNKGDVLFREGIIMII